MGINLWGCCREGRHASTGMPSRSRDLGAHRSTCTPCKGQPLSLKYQPLFLLTSQGKEVSGLTRRCLY